MSFLRFTNENKVDLDELYILKITFKNSLELVWGMSHSISYRIFSRISHKIFSARFSHKIFPQDFPARFPARFLPQEFSHKIFPTRISRKIFPARISHKIFPTRISCKIFPQGFPTRFSHKIFLQDFLELHPDWLAPHHPIANAKFPPIIAFLKLAFSPPPFPQDFPTRFSCKDFPQEFPARISRKIFPAKIFSSCILIGWLPITLLQMLNFHQLLPFLNWLFSPSSISHKIFLQDFPTRISRKDFPQEFPAKDFPQDFPAIFSRAASWLVGSPSPYCKC